MKTRIISEDEFTILKTRVRAPHGRETRHGTPAYTRPTDGSTAAVSSVRTASHAPSPYKSKWEAAYASKLELEKTAGIVFQYWYEPFSIWLPGKVRYKPDFMVKHAGDPVMEVIEVKGWSRNRRDGITRLKIAAALFPCFVWRMVYRTKGGGWDGEYL